MLPTFVIIGSTKSGTTALHKYIAAHPQAFVAKPKELRFFSAPERWRRGVEWYAERFADAGDALARGESSPQYAQDPRVSGVPARMAGVIPDARLLYIVRDPIERVLSQYRYRCSRGRETRPLEEAVFDEYYVGGSRYAHQLDRYVEHFDPSAIMVLTGEKLRSERLATMRRVYEHIGVDPRVPTLALATEHNRGDDKRRSQPVSRPMRALLRRSVAVGVDPATVRRKSRRMLDGDAQPRPVLPQDVRERLEDLLAPDAERMRAWVGADVEDWATLNGSGTEVGLTA